MVRTMVVSASLAVIPITNDLSIFSSSIGNCRRLVSDEKPVPKSSSEMRMPIDCSMEVIASACAGSAMMLLSVISTFTNRGSMFHLSRAA